MSWLSGLLARELPLKCLLRLWDAYFADKRQFSLHIYVCLGTPGPSADHKTAPLAHSLTKTAKDRARIVSLLSGLEKIQGRA